MRLEWQSESKTPVNVENCALLNGGPSPVTITETGGHKYRAETLDFGSTSVHNIIGIKTLAGKIGIDTLWSAELQIVQGVNYGDVTTEGLMISSLPTGQSLLFTGVSLTDLDQVMKNAHETPFGFGQKAVSLVDRAYRPKI
ncbi:MAG: hypothetical protein JKY94_07755 [Rhodobacteraceae bacterium]|nr:hypothetical protein [Paracoccaceae bacterium]